MGQNVGSMLSRANNITLVGPLKQKDCRNAQALAEDRITTVCKARMHQVDEFIVQSDQGIKV